MFLLSPTPYEFCLYFSQEVTLCLGLLVLLLASTHTRFSNTGARLTLIFLALTSTVLVFCSSPAVHHLVITNTAISWCKFFVSIAFILTLVIDAYCSPSSTPALVVMGFGFLAMLALLSSNDWFFLFLCIELLTLSSYCLIGLARTKRALEAVIKYFAAGALSACFLLFGILIFFISTETTSFFVFPADQNTALSFSVFITSAMLLKTGASPFHYWVADSYEGAPSTITVLLAVTVKLCIFLLLCRILFGPLFEGSPFWRPIIMMCSGLSIIFGCLGALFQKKIKRLLAYSSINNVGYGLAGLSVANLSGLQASIAYMCLYALSVLLLFSLILGPCGTRAITYVSELRRLRPSSLCAVLSTLVLFSMAGIPPLTGFWIKFFILYELMAAKLYLLAIIGALGSVLSSFYYISLIKILYFEEGDVSYSSTVNPSLPVPLLGMLAASLFVYPLAPNEVSYFFGYVASGFLTEFL